MDERRILLVEDEKKIADTLRRGLSEQGFWVEVAYDGLIALRLFEQHAFDVVVLDLNLPGLNGYELCRRIRARNPRIPLVVLTALGALEDKLEGYDAGADDYLVKPFEFQELLVKLRVLLKRSLDQHLPQGRVLGAGDLELHLDSREVRRQGRVISLTAKEFQLLEYLLRNKNKVVSRAAIAINVWDIDFDTNTNVIDVYISYLRNKVDKGFDQKLIHTQVGLGYCLKEKT
ncbi:MAG TPA: response regulator transcription factor [Flavisolibacter sp.]|nr:response regulator transcription factor [Flavisolibacter sp.]